MGDSYVVTGAMMTCTFGMSPVSLIVNPSRTKFLSNMPRANIMDYAPMVNIMPFGMCNTMSNPVVAAATAAKMGVFTPAACIPAIVAPWMPGNPQCMVQGQPALTRNSQCMCMWGGLIRFTNDGQMPGPPPIITPPIEVPGMPMPLSMQERSRMSEEEQEQYEEDMKEAAKAGNSDLETSRQLDDMAKRYEDEGNYKKAKQAREASQQFKERAAEKQAAAMTQTIEKYRNGGNSQNAQAPMSKEELNDIYTNARKDEAAKREEIADIDRQMEKNDKEFSKSQEKLNKANDKLIEADRPYQDARVQRQVATAKREDSQMKAAFFEREEMEARAAEHPDKAVIEENRKKKEQFQKTAKEAAKEEAKLQEKENKAKKELDKASREQHKAAEEYNDCLETHKELSSRKKEAQAAKDESSKTAFAAMRAMDAQEQQEQHQAAVERHAEAKADTRDKRLTMDEYAREENKATKEADAWYQSAQRAREQGNDELRDKFYANTARYDEEAKEARTKKYAAVQEWEDSKEELKKAYEEAWSDDALLDKYTADLKYDQAVKELKSKK